VGGGIRRGRWTTRFPSLVALVAVPIFAAPRATPVAPVDSPERAGDVSIGASASPSEGAERFIIEVDDANSLNEVVAEQENLGVDVVHEWDDVSTGFAAELTPAEQVRLADDPAVTDIHVDQIVTLDATQPSAPWGLDRIDQRNLPLNGTYEYTSTGAGITAYVIDTGIRTTHVEFQGRVGTGAFIDFGDGRGVQDCNGHGTHVSGIVGGTVSGVAKGVTIVPVKVFGCTLSTFTSDVIAGLDWIIGNHLPGQPAVLNMSLGTDAVSTPLDTAVNAVIADGVTVVAAAGNSSIPTCNVSPARVPNAITVAAINADDTRAAFSNTGSCNDLFAPGSLIVSSGIAGDTAAATFSGTSMAAPFVTGAVARYLETQPTATTASVRSAINASTDPGVVNGAAGDPDKLLYLAPPAPPCTPPPAGIIGWWTGEDSLTAEVGPSLTGNAAYGPSQVATGFTFDGMGWLSTPDVQALTSALTVEAWVRPNSDTQVQTIAARWDFPSTDDAARTFSLRLQPGSQLVFETDETTTRRPEILKATAPQLHDGQAHHVAAT
jgi:subtilisin family serine protease